jgi:histidine triad (HIT) family protein
MSDCIFCKIIKGEIPCDKVYEDENFYSFLDNGPVADGHLLIIPKHHVVWMQEASNEILSGIFSLAKKLMNTLKKTFQCDYIQVSVGGTDVPHFHVHLIPRYSNDGLDRFPNKKYKDGESEEIAKKIIKAF